MGKVLGFSLPTSLTCIKWSQSFITYIWAKMLSQQSISQKRAWLDTKNKPFPPPHQTTPSISPLTVGPPPLHWLGTSWWCSDHNVVIPLLSVFVFLLSHAISAVATQLCLVLLLHSLCLCFFFYGGWYGLVPFLPFLRPVGLPTAIFCRVSPLGFISLSFLSGFYCPLFLPLLTNLFLHPFLLVIGFLCCWTPLIKNGYQQFIIIIIIIIF